MLPCIAYYFKCTALFCVGSSGTSSIDQVNNSYTGNDLLIDKDINEHALFSD